VNQKGVSLIELLVVMIIGVLILIGLYQVLEQNQKVFRVQQQITVANNQTRAAMEIMIRTIRSAGSNRMSFSPAHSIYTAEQNRIRILLDLPHDFHDPTDTDSDGITCNDPDGSTFAIMDCDGSGVPGDADNENENGDDRINDSGEDVTFFLNGDQLISRQFSDSPGLETGNSPTNDPISIDPDPPAPSDQLLAENIMELTFQYFLDSSTPIALTGSPLQVPDSSLGSIKIVRITIVTRTGDKDKVGGSYHTIQLTSDAELRNR